MAWTARTYCTREPGDRRRGAGRAYGRLDKEEEEEEGVSLPIVYGSRSRKWVAATVHKTPLYTRIAAAFNRTHITRDKRAREKTHIIHRTSNTIRCGVAA